MKKNILCYICLFVFILLIVGGVMFYSYKKGFIILNFNKNKDDIIDSTKNEEEVFDINVYNDFILNKEYLNDLGSDLDYSDKNFSYSYFDLNKDGVQELVLYFTDDTDFTTNLFYTYDNSKIVFIDKVYHYGNITYNDDMNSIVYTDVRPSMSYGYAYGVYQLVDNKFILNKTLVVEINNGISKYYISNNDSENTEITLEEYNKYFDKNVIVK